MAMDGWMDDDEHGHCKVKTSEILTPHARNETDHRNQRPDNRTRTGLRPSQRMRMEWNGTVDHAR